MKIYTRTGDKGTTGLFGGGRLNKSHPRIEAYGTVDELNAAIGLARSSLSDAAGTRQVDDVLKRVQSELFVLGADLATPLSSKASVPRVSPEMIVQLESDIDDNDAEMPDLTAFVMPAGSPAAAGLHLARTICRRAERRVVHLAGTEHGLEHDIVYLNRLADLLFVLARRVNHACGDGDQVWTPSDKT